MPCRQIEVGQPVGVGLVGPGQPEPLHPVADVRVLDQRRGLDAVAEQVGREGFASIPGVAVGHHELTGAGQEPRAAEGDQ